MRNVISFRPATADDRAFVDALLHATMHEYVEATWPGNEEAQRHYYDINRFNFANTRIIQVDGKDVGRISTTVFSDHIFIDEIHIAPEYQHRGIGRQAIEQVVKEAREMRLPITATILIVNRPSQGLFLGMGFKVMEEKDHRFHIKYMPT